MKSHINSSSLGGYSINKKRIVLFIGGPVHQLPAISWAKEAGLYTIVTDLNPTSHGKDLADEFFCVSAFDYENIEKNVLEKHKVSDIVFVYTSSDNLLEAVAHFNTIFDKKGPTLSEIEKFQDKLVMKNLLHNYGLPTPRMYDLSEVSSVKRYFINNQGFGLVVKPARSCGSKGVLNCHSYQDVLEAVGRARSFSEDVIIEERIGISNVVYSVSILLRDSSICDVFIVDLRFSGSEFLLKSMTYPSNINEHSESLVYDLVTNFITSLKLRDGPFCMQVVLDQNGHPYVLEAMPYFVSDVLQLQLDKVTKSNPLKLFFRLLSGAQMPSTFDSYELSESRGSSVHRVFSYPENVIGHVSKINIDHEQLSSKGVFQVTTNVTVGDYVGGATNSADYWCVVDMVSAEEVGENYFSDVFKHTSIVVS